MKQVFVLCGIPGSGKSTVAKTMWPTAKVVSADDFFMVEGEYRFDPLQIGQAHNTCFRNFIESLQAGVECVVVDNTNTEVVELAPYMQAAAAFGYEAKAVTILCNPKTAIKRNIHKVPDTTIYQMDVQIRNRKCPSYWAMEVVDFDPDYNLGEFDE